MKENVSPIVHQLVLNRSILASENAADGTIALREYRSHVAKNDLEPDPARQLANGYPLAEITPGKYLFLQENFDGVARDEFWKAEAESRYREAAEKLWLEALWREAEFTDDRVLVRILSEDGKTVFQLFRKIK